jgi:hypothetical protein
MADTEYVKIAPHEMSQIQFIIDKFYDHIWQKQNINSFQRDLYHEIFNIPRPDTLPTPRKVKFKGVRVNTYSMLMEGLLHNFNSGTQDFSNKTFEHAVFVYNLAVKYFDEIHPDYEPTYVAHYFKPMKSSKI